MDTLFVVLCISIFGISIGVGVAKLQEVHPEYLSIGLIKGVVVFLFALFISVVCMRRHMPLYLNYKALVLE